MPAESTPLDDPLLYLNRELSWLQFNHRVLEEAQDPNVPLLERLKFLAIYSANLDEFFMVRVGNLHQKVQAGISRGSGADRMTATEQLERISSTLRTQVAEVYHCLDSLTPILAEHGIFVRQLNELTDSDRTYLTELFRSSIFPVLTPLAIDTGHPFPHLVNKSLNLGVVLRRPGDDEALFAVVQVPSVLPRLLQLPRAPIDDPTDEGKPSDPLAPFPAKPTPIVAFAPLETAIGLHLNDLFPGMEILDSACFRVTRDSEFELDEDVEDLLRAIEENVKQRRRGQAVRLEIESDATLELEDALMTALDLRPNDVARVPGLIDLTGLFQIHALPGYVDLRDPEHVPAPIRDFAQASNLWAAIRAKDVLIHHPYESFKPVVDFIDAAAVDDRVLAIKQTLYRTSSDSPIVKALQRAADRGKQVTAVIELKARLDEERNILWAKELEKSGVHVVYGFIGLKTHCKCALVVRKEDDGIRRYVHLATGNYNPQTARLYTDLGFFTTNSDFADDVTLLFNYLTGYAELPQWRKLIVAPSRLLKFMIERIERETEQTKEHGGGRIVAKVNGLMEPTVIQALYRASQAGVKVDLIVRGICALRPGIPGVSDNIRVTSVVDRFLEHSRIFYFENRGDPEVFIGSADWMDRNLVRRVEVVFPIDQADLKARVIDEILALSLADNVKARELQPDGSYVRVQPEENAPTVRSQNCFLELALESERRFAISLSSEPMTSDNVNGPLRLAKRKPMPKDNG